MSNKAMSLQEYNEISAYVDVYGIEVVVQTLQFICGQKVGMYKGLKMPIATRQWERSERRLADCYRFLDEFGPESGCR